MPKKELKCSLCGKIIDLDFYSITNPLVDKMRSASLCFDCMYWKEFFDTEQPENTVIIEGKVYCIVPIKNRHQINSKKRETYFAICPENRNVIAFSQFRVVGTVPKNFLDRITEEYKFVSRDTYEKASSFDSIDCLSRGCYDRYDCFWYNQKEAEPNGPWNKIPSNHVAGEELCESFINKNTMYNGNRIGDNRSI